MTENPDFRNRAFLVSHIKDTMAFYHPACIDNKGGGFFQHFRDDGSIYDADTRHLVRSTRFIFNYAMAATSLESSESKRQQYLEAVRHGIAYLRNRHCNVQTGGYAWLLSADRVVDATNHSRAPDAGYSIIGAGVSGILRPWKKSNLSNHIHAQFQ